MQFASLIPPLTPTTPASAAAEVLWCPDLAPILDNVLPTGIARMRHTTEASLYITERLLSYDDEALGDGPWVPLHSKTLAAVVGWRYTSQLLDALVAGGVLECDESYQVGEVSKGYRLTQAAALFPKTCVEVSPWLAKKIRLQRHHRNLATIQVSAPAKAIYLDLARFGWEPGIREALEQLCQDDPLSAGHYRMMVHRIAHQQHFIAIANSGRLFHSVATMAKKLRRRLLADGQPCCELDVAGCQANCLVLLYEGGDEEERARYIASARLDPYEYLAGLIEQATGRRPPRDEVKLAWFREIFGKDHLRGQVYAALKRAFPILCARMETVRKPGYKAMAHRLQGIEAHLMIETVVPRIKARLGDTPIATVHDSIICQRQVAAAVKEVIEGALEEQLGYVPLIRLTDGILSCGQTCAPTGPTTTARSRPAAHIRPHHDLLGGEHKVAHTAGKWIEA